MSRRKLGRRTHWTVYKIKNNHIITRRKHPAPHRSGFKPYGLWYEVEGESDWQWFCNDESFRDLKEAYKYEVKIGDECNILKIRDVPNLAAFTAVWGFEPKWERDWRLSKKAQRLIPNIPIKYSIDWDGVMAVYDGIEIAPYQWTRRLTDRFWWYYGWDVASGCLWRPKNSTLRMLRQPLKRRRRARQKKNVLSAV